jgi:hypothetical protein
MEQPHKEIERVNPAETAARCPIRLFEFSAMRAR